MYNMKYINKRMIGARVCFVVFSHFDILSQIESVCKFDGERIYVLCWKYIRYVFILYVRCFKSIPHVLYVPLLGLGSSS